jgi:hypothetical protein
MTHVLRKATVAAVLATLAVPALAAADNGTTTCLTGFQWRAAFSGDRVCVPRAHYDQAQGDNRAAASRREPNAVWGENACKSGWVWRVARPSDLVCVAPAVRDQAAADNAAADMRRNSVKLTVDRWHSQGVWRYLLSVQNINRGKAYIGLYQSGGKPIAGWHEQTRTVLGRPGGSVLAFKTNRLVCSGQPNAYFRAKDPTSGLWSRRVPVRTGCVVI